MTALSAHLLVDAGYDMDEMYAFDLKAHTWELIAPKGPKPAARYLHTAVVIKDAMVIFGGSESALGDVWSFNFKSRRWTQLSKVHSSSSLVLGPHRLACMGVTFASIFFLKPATVQSSKEHTALFCSFLSAYRKRLGC